MMRRIKNETGVFNARVGRYNGVESIFTHRDPKTGYLWGENLPCKDGSCVVFGRWVPADSVEFI